jgi:hypothetical protein
MQFLFAFSRHEIVGIMLINYLAAISFSAMPQYMCETCALKVIKSLVYPGVRARDASGAPSEVRDLADCELTRR